MTPERFSRGGSMPRPNACNELAWLLWLWRSSGYPADGRPPRELAAAAMWEENEMRALESATLRIPPERDGWYYGDRPESCGVSPFAA